MQCTVIAGEPARPWRAEVTYKTLKSAAAAKTNPLAENEQQQGPGGESLYVVKSTEFPGRTFMMVRVIWGWECVYVCVCGEGMGTGGEGLSLASCRTAYS